MPKFHGNFDVITTSVNNHMELMAGLAACVAIDSEGHVYPNVRKRRRFLGRFIERDRAGQITGIKFCGEMRQTGNMLLKVEQALYRHDASASASASASAGDDENTKLWTRFFKHHNDHDSVIAKALSAAERAQQLFVYTREEANAPVTLRFPGGQTDHPEHTALQAAQQTVTAEMLAIINQEMTSRVDTALAQAYAEDVPHSFGWERTFATISRDGQYLRQGCEHAIMQTTVENRITAEIIDVDLICRRFMPDIALCEKLLEQELLSPQMVASLVNFARTQGSAVFPDLQKMVKTSTFQGSLPFELAEQMINKKIIINNQEQIGLMLPLQQALISKTFFSSPQEYYTLIVDLARGIVAEQRAGRFAQIMKAIASMSIAHILTKLNPHRLQDRFEFPLHLTHGAYTQDIYLDYLKDFAFFSLESFSVYYALPMKKIAEHCGISVAELMVIDNEIQGIWLAQKDAILAMAKKNPRLNLLSAQGNCSIEPSAAISSSTNAPQSTGIMDDSSMALSMSLDKRWLEEIFRDPITFDNLNCPGIADDGRVYSRETIAEYLDKRGRSPFTEQPTNGSSSSRFTYAPIPAICNNLYNPDTAINLDLLASLFVDEISGEYMKNGGYIYFNSVTQKILISSEPPQVAGDERGGYQQLKEHIAVDMLDLLRDSRYRINVQVLKDEMQKRIEKASNAAKQNVIRDGREYAQTVIENLFIAAGYVAENECSLEKRLAYVKSTQVAPFVPIPSANRTWPFFGGNALRVGSAYAMTQALIDARRNAVMQAATPMRTSAEEQLRVASDIGSISNLVQLIARSSGERAAPGILLARSTTARLASREEIALVPYTADTVNAATAASTVNTGSASALLNVIAPEIEAKRTKVIYMVIVLAILLSTRNSYRRFAFEQTERKRSQLIKVSDWLKSLSAPLDEGHISTALLKIREICSFRQNQFGFFPPQSLADFNSLMDSYQLTMGPSEHTQSLETFLNRFHVPR